MIRLYPFERSDFERVIEWATDTRFLMQWAGPIFTHPLDHDQLDGYLGKAFGREPRRVIWKGVDDATGVVVGHIEIDKIDYGRRTGALSRVLIGIPGMRGRGLGRQLVGEALRLGFDELRLGEITLAVFDFNHAAIRCYEINGFEQFHTRSGAVTVEGEKWGALFMRLTERRWRGMAAGVSER